MPPAAWASYQIRKIAGCACAGNVFSRRQFQRKPLVRDPGMHQGTCVKHVPWCMLGSLTCGDGENVPGIPGACAPAILRIWQEAHRPAYCSFDHKSYILKSNCHQLNGFTIHHRGDNDAKIVHRVGVLLSKVTRVTRFCMSTKNVPPKSATGAGLTKFLIVNFYRFSLMIWPLNWGLQHSINLFRPRCLKRGHWSDSILQSHPAKSSKDNTDFVRIIFNKIFFIRYHWFTFNSHTDGLVQKRRNSIALAT